MNFIIYICKLYVNLSVGKTLIIKKNTILNKLFVQIFFSFVIIFIGKLQHNLFKCT